ncbi:hypothetical protein FRX31_011036, partial [Thalictrum thalictroides]
QLSLAFPLLLAVLSNFLLDGRFLRRVESLSWIRPHVHFSRFPWIVGSPCCVTHRLYLHDPHCHCQGYTKEFTDSPSQASIRN